MTDNASWHEQNTKYLGAAVAAIRARLQQYAKPEPPSVVPPEPAEPGETRFLWRSLRRKQIAPPPVEHEAPPASSPMPSVPALLPAPGETPPALRMLVERLNLTPFERDILMLCAAMELDTGMAALCARAQDPARPHPTFALALAALENPAWEALSPDHPLRYWRLIEIHQPNGQPLTLSALRADERIVNYLKGLNYLDDRLASVLHPLEIEAQPTVPESQRTLQDAILARLKQTPRDRKLPPV